MIRPNFTVCLILQLNLSMKSLQFAKTKSVLFIVYTVSAKAEIMWKHPVRHPVRHPAKAAPIINRPHLFHNNSPMKRDFFLRRPIHHALIYLLRTTLRHAHSDEQRKKPLAILRGLIFS